MKRSQDVKIYRAGLLGLLLCLCGWSHAQNSSKVSDPFSGKYRYLSLGYEQFDKGFFTVGAKFVNWNHNAFSSNTISYGYNPWSDLHLLRYNADLTLYFINLGLEANTVTNGEQFNVIFRPQVGVYFVYFGLNFGPNLWVNQHHQDQLNRWIFNVEINLPLDGKRTQL